MHEIVRYLTIKLWIAESSNKSNQWSIRVILYQAALHSMIIWRSLKKSRQFAEENDEMKRRSIRQRHTTKYKTNYVREDMRTSIKWKGSIVLSLIAVTFKYPIRSEDKRIYDYDICDFIGNSDMLYQSQYFLPAPIDHNTDMRDSIFLPKYTRHRTTTLTIAIFVDN